MKECYDYEELLSEIRDDITKGLIEPDGIIFVARGEKVFGHYLPIIDYYYAVGESSELTQMMRGQDAISEMEKWDSIF